MASLSDGNFTGLRASLGDWVHRSDLSNTDMGNFIFMFEKNFNTELRLRNMEAQTNIPITSGYLTHPADWVQWKSITRIQGNYRVPLNPVTEEGGSLDYGYSHLSEPRGYVVRGDKTIIMPTDGSGNWTYEGVYFVGVPALTATASTNWLLNAYPQAYLCGSLLWATSFIEDPEVATWKAVVDEVLDKIKQASKRQSLGGGIAYARPDRVY